MKKNVDKAVRSLITPTEDERRANSDLLGESNSGVFTFLNPNRCARANAINDREMKLCRAGLPNNGTQFSFRRQTYVSFGHADLAMSGDWFFGFGYATQTILTDVGNVPLAVVDLNRPDIQFLVDFVPAPTLLEANKQRVELEEGVVGGSGAFFNAVKIVKDHTYVLRSIAYRGEMVTVVNTGTSKLKFDMLKNDVREDVTVALRVLQRDEAGSARILWRILQTKTSPRIDLPVQDIDGSNVQRSVTVVN